MLTLITLGKTNKWYNMIIIVLIFLETSVLTSTVAKLVYSSNNGI